MAHSLLPLLLLLPALSSSLLTCPGFPGYCSESFPGQSCNVVCSVGRNNVPLCQDDGTWTDIPRCIEHEPGVEEQIPGLCPSIPGYCSQAFLNHRCTFDCRGGPDIDSICTADGTWAPYPTCQGDLRDAQDGCDGCPGPRGGKRNRTAEAINSQNTISDRRVPKVILNDGGRKNIPSFAGNINIGPISNTRKPNTQESRFGSSGRQTPSQRRTTPRTTPRPSFQTNFNQQQPQQRFPQQQRPQQQFNQQPRQQQPRQQQPRQQQRPIPQQPRSQRPVAQQPRSQQLPASQQPRSQVPRSQQSVNEGNSLSLFDQIKQRINQGKQQQQQPQPPQQPQFQQPQDTVQRRPITPTFRRPGQQQPLPSRQPPASGSTFGVFDAVDLSGPLRGPNPSPAAPAPRAPRVERPGGNGEFFGEFQSVNLQRG